ncbi:MAG: hypothetical protein K8S54_07655, partial [Spirochaetia bacterium]|nr:hypothetical protein [Spirochaetia bacterium]
EMPLLARSPEAEHFRKLQVFPLLMSSQVRKPDWGPFGKQRQPGYQSGSLAPERAEIVIMGTQRRAFKITMRSGENAALVDEYFVEDNSNRTLLAWNRHDGAKFVLKRHNFETVDR